MREKPHYKLRADGTLWVWRGKRLGWVKVLRQWPLPEMAGSQ